VPSINADFLQDFYDQEDGAIELLIDSSAQDIEFRIMLMDLTT
jgi:hypothetical protein